MNSAVVSVPGILLAAVVAWIFGAAWYGLLGKAWMTARGWSEADILARKKQVPVGPMILSFLAELIMAIVLSGLLAHVAKTGATVKAGVIVAALCWLGFVATTLIVNNAYGGARSTLSVIDGGHWLGVLLLQGAILGFMGG